LYLYKKYKQSIYGNLHEIIYVSYQSSKTKSRRKNQKRQDIAMKLAKKKTILSTIIKIFKRYRIGIAGESCSHRKEEKHHMKTQQTDRKI